MRRLNQYGCHYPAAHYFNAKLLNPRVLQIPTRAPRGFIPLFSGNVCVRGSEEWAERQECASRWEASQRIFIETCSLRMICDPSKLQCLGEMCGTATICSNQIITSMHSMHDSCLQHNPNSVKKETRKWWLCCSPDLDYKNNIAKLHF